MHWYGLVHVARLRSTAIHSTSHPVVRRGPVPFLSFLVVVINSHMIVVLLLIALRIIIRQKVPIASAVLVRLFVSLMPWRRRTGVSLVSVMFGSSAIYRERNSLGS